MGDYENSIIIATHLTIKPSLWPNHLSILIILSLSFSLRWYEFLLKGLSLNCLPNVESVFCCLFFFIYLLYMSVLYFYQRLNLILIILMGVFQSRLAFLNLITCVVWMYGCEIHVFGLYFQVHILCAREEFMRKRKLVFCL